MKKLINLSNKTNILIFSIIVITTPILNVIVNNLDQKSINFYEVFLGCLVLTIIYLTLVIILKFFFKFQSKKLFVSSSIIFYFFFLYSVINFISFKIFSSFFSLLEIQDHLNILSVALWFVTFFLIIVAFKKFYNEKIVKSITSIFLIIFSVNFFYISKNIFFKSDNIKKTEGYFEHEIKNFEFNYKPNIYFIISDMYADTEYLNKIYPTIDNGLDKFLIEKKFITKKNSLSNYPHTTLSILSILNSSYFKDEYFFNNEKSLPNFSSLLKNHNKTNEILKFNNYKSQYIFCWGDHEEKKKYCINKKDISYLGNLDISFVQAVLHHSFLRNIFDITKSKNSDNRKYLSNYYEIINFAKNQPQFNYIHLYFPHPPYIFNDDCSFRNIPKDDLVVNNKLIIPKEKRFKGYLKNLSCSSIVVKKMIEKIIDEDPDSIIVFAADHGPHLQDKQKDLNFSYINILDMHSASLAIRSENYCKNKVSQSQISHVNILRILLNCFSDEKINLLPQIIFYEDVNHKSIRSKKLNLQEIQRLRLDSK